MVRISTRKVKHDYEFCMKMDGLLLKILPMGYIYPGRRLLPSSTCTEYTHLPLPSVDLEMMVLSRSLPQGRSRPLLATSSIL